MDSHCSKALNKALSLSLRNLCNLKLILGVAFFTTDVDGQVPITVPAASAPLIIPDATDGAMIPWVDLESNLEGVSLIDGMIFLELPGTYYIGVDVTYFGNSSFRANIQTFLTDGIFVLPNSMAFSHHQTTNTGALTVHIDHVITVVDPTPVIVRAQALDIHPMLSPPGILATGTRAVVRRVK
jgi:hypothetical protein